MPFRSNLTLKIGNRTFKRWQPPQPPRILKKDSATFVGLFVVGIRAWLHHPRLELHSRRTRRTYEGDWAPPEERPLRKPLNWPPKHIPWYLCVVIDALWLYLIKADCPWFLCISVMIISLMARIFGSGFPLTASYRKGRFLWNGSKRTQCHGLMCHFGNIGRIEGATKNGTWEFFSKDLYHPKGGQRLAASDDQKKCGTNFRRAGTWRIPSLNWHFRTWKLVVGIKLFLLGTPIFQVLREFSGVYPQRGWWEDDKSSKIRS